MSRRNVVILMGLMVAYQSSPADAQNRAGTLRHNEASPFNQVEPRIRDDHHERTAPGPLDVRSIDGSANHLVDTEMNASHTALVRSVPAAYDDGVSSLAGQDRPGARDISNLINTQTQLVPNPYGTSDYLWQWGQFVDHDIDLSEGVDPPEAAFIPAIPTSIPSTRALSRSPSTVRSTIWRREPTRRIRASNSMRSRVGSTPRGSMARVPRAHPCCAPMMARTTWRRATATCCRTATEPSPMRPADRARSCSWREISAPTSSSA